MTRLALGFDIKSAAIWSSQRASYFAVFVGAFNVMRTEESSGSFVATAILLASAWVIAAIWLAG